MTQVRMLLMNEVKGPLLECIYFFYDIVFYFNNISTTQRYMREQYTIQDSEGCPIVRWFLY